MLSFDTTILYSFLPFSPAPTVVLISVEDALWLFAGIYLFHNSCSIWFILPDCCIMLSGH